MRIPKLTVALLAATAAGLVSAAPGLAQSFQVLSVQTTGCTNGAFRMIVERAGLDGSPYTVRTVVTVGELIYMNESATTLTNGQANWALFDTFSYGTTLNKGTWPIPEDTQVRMDFTLEQPKGTVLYAWTTVVKSCNAGGIQYNGTTATLPLRPRTLALNYDNASGRFIGWLYSQDAPKFHRKRTVTIWKVRKGADRKIGKAKTSPRGNFSLRHERRKGRYYAVAPAILQPPAGHAMREVSVNLRVR